MSTGPFGVAVADDFATGKPCDADGPNSLGSNKWCRYEEPHKHGSYACDRSCPCRRPVDDNPSTTLPDPLRPGQTKKVAASEGYGVDDNPKEDNRG